MVNYEDMIGERLRQLLKGVLQLHPELPLTLAQRLDIADLRRSGRLRPPWGRAYVQRLRLDVENDKVAYAVQGTATMPWCLIALTSWPVVDPPEGYFIPIVPIPCGRGTQPLLACPMEGCVRRCRALFRPLTAPWFGCRSCYGLRVHPREEEPLPSCAAVLGPPPPPSPGSLADVEQRPGPRRLRLDPRLVLRPPSGGIHLGKGSLAWRSEE